MSKRKSPVAPSSGLIPLLVVGVALSQTSLEGPTQDVAFLVLGIALLMCILLAVRHARVRQE